MAHYVVVTAYPRRTATTALTPSLRSSSSRKAHEQGAPVPRPPKQHRDSHVTAGSQRHNRRTLAPGRDTHRRQLKQRDRTMIQAPCADRFAAANTS
jgi:hypothetical protein